MKLDTYLWQTSSTHFSPLKYLFSAFSIVARPISKEYRLDMSQQQKAILIKELGKPVELVAREIPSPKEDQILLKVTAAARKTPPHQEASALKDHGLTWIVLPHDSYCRDWGLFIDGKLPWVPASCVAGIITELGTQVTSCKEGDLIFGLSDYDTPKPDQSGLQQYAVLNANAIAKVPAGFTDEQMVTLPVNLTTSWNVLFSSAGFGFTSPFSPEGKKYDYSKQSIVVIGGGSNVGKFALQVASVTGFGSIVTVAGWHNKDVLLKMGATHVIDRHAPHETIVAQIRNIIGEATYVYDCVNYTDFSLAAAILPKSIPSKLRTLLPIESLDMTSLPRCDALAIESTNDLMAPYQRQLWEKVPQWVERGKVLPSQYRVLNGLEKVDEINQALNSYQDFDRSGVVQVVVRI